MSSKKLARLAGLALVLAAFFSGGVAGPAVAGASGTSDISTSSVDWL